MKNSTTARDFSAQRIAKTLEVSVDDPVRDKPRRSGLRKDSADFVAVPGFQCGVCCCSMYCRTMEIGVPPQDEAKQDGDHRTPRQ